MITEKHLAIEAVPIKMPERPLKKLVGKASSNIDKAKKARRNMEEKWAVGIDQYHSRLEVEAAETEDSDIDIPSTRQFCEMAESRYMNPIFQRDRIYAGRAVRPGDDDVALAKSFEDFANYITLKDGIAKFRSTVKQSLKQRHIYTKTVARVEFIHKQERILDYYNPNVEAIFDPVTGEMENAEEFWVAKKNSDGKFVTKERMITVESGAYIEVVPTPDFFHPIPCADINTAAWVSHRVWMTSDQVEDRIRNGDFNEKYCGKPLMEALGDPSAKQDQKILMSLNEEEKEGTDKDSEKLFEVHELFTTLNGKEVVMWLEPNKKVCLSFVENWRHQYKRPFKTLSYDNILYDIDGVSLCYILEPYHRALSACVNQRLDAASAAMSSWLFFADSSGLGHYLKNQQLPRGAYSVSLMGAQSINDQVQQFHISQPFNQMVTLEQDLMRNMQKLAGLTDYNAGVEQIERPTAEGQKMLISEGSQPQYDRMEDLRAFLADLLYMQIALYKQHWPEGLNYYLQEAPEKDIISGTINWPAEYWPSRVKLETSVSSQTMDRDSRKKERNGVREAMPAEYEMLIQFASQAMDKENPGAGFFETILRFHEDHVLIPWMKDYNIGGDEQIKLSDSIDTYKQWQEAMDELQQQITELQRENTGKDQAIEQLATAYQAVDQRLTEVAREYFATLGHYPTSMGSGEAGPVEGAVGIQGAPPIS